MSWRERLADKLLGPNDTHYLVKKGEEFVEVDPNTAFLADGTLGINPKAMPVTEIEPKRVPHKVKNNSMTPSTFLPTEP